MAHAQRQTTVDNKYLRTYHVYSHCCGRFWTCCISGLRAQELQRRNPPNSQLQRKTRTELCTNYNYRETGCANFSMTGIETRICPKTSVIIFSAKRGECSHSIRNWHKHCPYWNPISTHYFPQSPCLCCLSKRKHPPPPQWLSSQSYGLRDEGLSKSEDIWGKTNFQRFVDFPAAVLGASQ